MKTRNTKALAVAAALLGVAVPRSPVRAFQAPPGGVIVGRVLCDLTGLPIPGASVQMGAQSVLSDESGRYLLPASSAAALVVAQKDGMTAVVRPAASAPGTQFSPVDMRLTALAPATRVGAAGGTLSAGPILLPVGRIEGVVPAELAAARFQLTVPAGAVAAETQFRATPLSGQALPGLLPLGWSPVAALDLRASAAVSAPLPVRVSGVASGLTTVHLAAFHPTHGWRLQRAGVAAAGGVVDSELPGPGAYAWVVPDDVPAPELPAPGEPLRGVPAEEIPSGAVGGGAFSRDAIVPEVVVRRDVWVNAALPLPSGTVLQASAKELFTLRPRELTSLDERVHDVVLYRVRQAPASDPAAAPPPEQGWTLFGSFPVAPSPAFAALDRVVEGTIDLSLRAGRESVRAATAGQQTTQVDSGDARLVVPAGAFPQGTAVTVRAEAPGAGVPVVPGGSPLTEVSVDLSGAVLSVSAELSLAWAAPLGQDAVLVARLDLIGGSLRPVVVSRTQLAGGRLVMQPYPGLPGVVKGGRYVFYRMTTPVGFVGGVAATSGGEPLRAVVGTAALPFVAWSGEGGRYLVPAAAGLGVEVKAWVPETTFQGHGRVQVAAGATAALDLTLTGVAVTAAVTPADGAVDVPADVQVEITTAVPLKEETATGEQVKLFRGPVSAGQAVAGQVRLSVSGLRLTLVPDQPLAPSTEYHLQVGGLADRSGGLVLVPALRFTTAAAAERRYDLERLVFSFPDAGGIVTASAPAGALPPGSTVMIVDSANGVVLTLLVDSDGAVRGELPATIHDELLVSLTDAWGNVTTATRTKYVDAVGKRVAIGAQGGTVEGEGGVQLRLPPGAVSRGVVFKLTAVPSSGLPEAERPGFPGAQLAGAVRIESPDRPAFDKEVDLAFPRPADAPAGAAFHIVRRIETPGGHVVHQTIDKGVVEGDKVVTASPPFNGIRDSIGKVGGGSFVPLPVGVNTVALLWTFQPDKPGVSPAGVITGKVFQATWDPTRRAYEYKPVAGAVVRRIKDGKDPLRVVVPARDNNIGVSGDDGTYTFYDPTFVMGTLTLRATLPTGEEKEVTGYDVTSAWELLPWVRSFASVATANFSFPAGTAPAPAVKLDAKVMVLDAAGKRKVSSGIEAAGTQLILGFTPDNATIESVTVNGEALSLADDPLQGQDPLGMAKIGQYVPVVTGSYSVRATLRPAAGAPAVFTQTFRVIAEGGSNNETLPDEPPQVITARTVPQPGAAEVPVTVFPQVVFTEPVTWVAPDGVVLKESASGRLVPIALSGVGPGGPVPVLEAGSVVTSLTVQPLTPLAYDRQYTLLLGFPIRDLDPADKCGPRSLPAYAAQFTTFAPAPLGVSEERYTSAGMAVLGDRAYTVQNLFHRGSLHTFDISDPTRMFEIPNGSPQVANRPVDIAAADETGVDIQRRVSGGRLVVVGTTATNRSVPSNLHLFDATDDLDMKLVAAASVTRGAIEGTLRRFVLHKGLAYAITFPRGIQVVDLLKVKQTWEEALARTAGSRVTPPASELNTDGQGFGLTSVVQTIPVVRKLPLPERPWWLSDLKVGEYAVQAGVQPLVLAVGQPGLVIADPLAGRHEPPFAIVDAAAGTAMDKPVALSLGRLGEDDVAVVAGEGTWQGERRALLAVVELARLWAPVELHTRLLVPLSGAELDGRSLAGAPTDVVLRPDATVIVASASNAVLVRLAQSGDRIVGEVGGVLSDMSGRLAVTDGSVVLSTAISPLGDKGADAPDSLHAASAGPCDLLTLPRREVELALTEDPVNGTTCGGPGIIPLVLCQPAVVTVEVNGVPVTAVVDGDATKPAAPIVARLLAPGRHQVMLPPRLLGLVDGEQAPLRVTAWAPDDPSRRDVENGVVTNAVKNRALLPVGRTYVKGVDLFDGHLARQSVDLKLPGRHLGLAVTRSHSSGGASHEGALGAGWSWSYGASAYASDCGLLTVLTADGGSQTFFGDADASGQPGNPFTPQRGYHGRLVKNPDQSLDFTDKAGTRHHFASDPSLPSRWRLEYVQEPHGDRIALSYDAAGRVVEVGEVPWEADGKAVRTLSVGWVRVGAYERISSIALKDVPGVTVRYAYDSDGNLVRATRLDADKKRLRAEDYEYSAADAVDPHQITAATDANGSRTEYAYYAATDTLPGDPVANKRDRVKEVRELAGAGKPPDRTRFLYDLSAARSGRWTTTVTNPRGHDTVYLLNSDGSPLEIREPLEKKTEMGWAPNDVYKLWEIDPQGRRSDYGYDGNGNLISERITTVDMGVVETLYQYDAGFNKLTYKKDAEGRETRYEIDSDNGDLLSQTDAVGNRTEYQYRGGVLVGVSDPRRHTTSYENHDSFGNPRLITDPKGNQAHRDYDSRGRLLAEWDSFGRRREVDYDALDRPIVEARRAGGGSLDQRTETEYYAGGEPRKVRKLQRSGRELVVEYTLDGRNRVTATRLTLPGAQGEGVLTSEVDYDPNGNKEYETDRRGVKRKMIYDDLDRLERVEIVSGPGAGPTGPIASYKYDGGSSNKTEETNLRTGRTTKYVYDGLYRVKEKVLPQSGPGGQPYRELTGWDKVGNRRSFTDANGNTTTFDYDGLNRLTKTTNALGQVKTVTYLDPEGSKVNKSEERDHTTGLRTSFTYDELNREASRTVHLEGPGSSGESYTTTTSYEDASHTVLVEDSRQVKTRTRLDGLDRPYEVVVDDGALNLTTRTSYDGLGYKTKVTDPRGNETRFEHDGLGRLVKTWDALGRDTAYEYDGEGLKTAQTDRRGVRTESTYDNLGRPRVTKLADAKLTGVSWQQEIRYDDAGHKRTEVDARGYQTVLHLDGLERVVKVEDPRGKWTETEYDGVNKIRERDKRGNWTSFEYDALGRLRKVTDPAPFQGQTVVTTYEDAANRRTVIDRRGKATVTQMDSLGRVRSVTRAGVLLETHSYDANNNKTLSTDGESHKTKLEYDAANRLWKRTEAAETANARTTTFGYDASGNLISEVDQRAPDAPVTKDYDKLNRLASVRDGEGHEIVYGYDEEGRQASVFEAAVDGVAKHTMYSHDELGKLIEVKERGAKPATTLYEYDPARNPIRRTQHSGEHQQVVEMRYDELNRLDLRREPGGATTAFDYDDNGNQRLVKQPKGDSVTITHDQLNRLETKTYAVAPGDTARPWRETVFAEYHYDPNNNNDRTEDKTASGTDSPTTLTTTREYDDFDRVKSETQPMPDGGSRAVEYTYYNNGLRKTAIVAGETTFYEYYEDNRLKKVTTAHGTAGAKTTEYRYWPDGLTKEIRFPNGVKTEYGYDKADRLTSKVTTANGQTVSTFNYEYDARNNRTKQIEINGGRTETTTYGYDDRDRLTSITYPIDETYPKGRVVTYEYDLVGNRTRETEKDNDGTVLADREGVFDPRNRLTELRDLLDPTKTIAYGYDADGNQTSKTEGGVTTTYLYEVRDNKLVEAKQGDHILFRYQYDCDGRLTKKIGNDGLRYYVYDQQSRVAEYGDSGTLFAKYDYGSDQLLSVWRPTGRQYFTLDGLGSVVNLTSETGAVQANYHLDTWGNYRFPNQLNHDRNRFGFTGYLWEEEAGLYFAKARFYDPKVARFTTADSFLGKADQPPSLHRYAYAHNRPTFFVDPTGHEVKAVGVDTTAVTWDEFGHPHVGAVTAVETETVDVVAYPDRASAVAATLDTTLAQPANRMAVRGMGAVRAAGGAVEGAVGAAALAAPDPTMLTKVAGGVLVAHGADTVQAGLRQAATGVVKETLTGTAIRKTAEAAGASPGTAALISAGGEMAIGLGAGVVATRGTAAAAAQAEARFQAEATRQARNAAIERGEYSVSGGSGANAESRGIGAQYVYDARAARHRDTTTGRFVAQRDLPYPPNAGFASSTRNPLTEGTIVERFGRPSGRFASDPGASISARGMPPGSEALLRHRYEVMKQVEVQMGPAAPVPAFGAEGGGIQYMFDRPISELISQGILKEVK